MRGIATSRRRRRCATDWVNCRRGCQVCTTSSRSGIGGDSIARSASAPTGREAPPKFVHVLSESQQPILLDSWRRRHSIGSTTINFAFDKTDALLLHLARTVQSIYPSELRLVLCVASAVLSSDLKRVRAASRGAGRHRDGVDDHSLRRPWCACR